MNTSTGPLQPHASLDLPSRYRKGRKIERLLDLAGMATPIHMLEVGTGSAGIAAYFARHPTLSCNVTAVDVIDQRQETDGFRFVQVRDSELPFDDDSFDVVLSNHVIEHVGSLAEQRRHLLEIHRVLKRDGVGYLAFPNRWALIEPHYRLALLSWLPRSWRSAYLRSMRRGDHYDCSPLTLSEGRQLLAESGFGFEYLGVRAVHEMVGEQAERSLALSLGAALPDHWIERLASVSPTLIFRIWRQRAAGDP